MNRKKYDTPKWNSILLSAIIGATLLAYSNHFHNAFHFDDMHTISSNVYIRDLKNIPKFFTDGTTGSSLRSNQSYRPVLTTTLAIDYKLQGGLSDTFWFHITSFTFFILQGILMFFLFKRIIEKASSTAPANFISAFSVAWYMLHPVCAETINYIIQRGDSLSTFFVLLGLVMYAAGGVWKKYYLYLIPAVLGCLTKPSALMFAPLLVTYIVLVEENVSIAEFFKNKNSSFGKTIPVALIAFIAIGIVFILLKLMESKDYVEGGFSVFNYRITQPFILFHEFRSWFAPIWLSADTDWLAFDSLLNPYVIGGFIFLIAAVYLLFVTSVSKITRPVSFGIAWFLIANFPTSFIAFSEVTNDHRMFFPYVGLAIAIPWTLWLLVEKFSSLAEVKSVRTVFFISIAVLLIGYGYGTRERNKVWKTDETLWADVAEKSPKNGRGLMNYGLALMARADYVNAEFYFTQALKYSPRYSYLLINMAILKDAVGKQVEAEEYFLKGIQEGKGTANSYYYYARYLYNHGRKTEAATNLLKADSIAPSDISVKYLLMDALYDLNRLAELKIVAENSLAVFPADTRAQNYLAAAQSGKGKEEMLVQTAVTTKSADEYLNLSLYYYNAGRFQECLNASLEALKIKPDYAAAYNNMCSAYNAMGKFEEGAKACESALKIQPDFQLAKNNLAWAKKNLPK